MSSNCYKTFSEDISICVFSTIYTKTAQLNSKDFLPVKFLSTLEVIDNVREFDSFI